MKIDQVFCYKRNFFPWIWHIPEDCTASTPWTVPITNMFTVPISGLNGPKQFKVIQSANERL